MAEIVDFFLFYAGQTESVVKILIFPKIRVWYLISISYRYTVFEFGVWKLRKHIVLFVLFVCYAITVNEYFYDKKTLYRMQWDTSVLFFNDGVIIYLFYVLHYPDQPL